MTDTKTENVRRGFWLRMARERAGISQATAAQELGLSGRSKSTLSAWEAGTREPRPSMVSRMAVLYGVPVERFMNPEPTAFETIDGWLPGSYSKTTTTQPVGLRDVAEMFQQATQSGATEGVRRAKGGRAPRTPAGATPSPERPARDTESKPAGPRDR